MVIIKSLNPHFAKASVSIFNDEYLGSVLRYYPEYRDCFIDEPVLKQSFKDYKRFFKELKNECLSTEFIFSLNIIKDRINTHIERIENLDEKELYYKEFSFDYKIVVNFIDRYIRLFKYFKSELLYHYCFELQKEIFFRDYSVNERLTEIRKTLDEIYFNEKYGKKNQYFMFGNLEFGLIYKFKEEDVKVFFESEIIKKEYCQLKNDNETIESRKALHGNIFKDNAFDVWQSMFESFNIKESSNTDLRFMFEVMKYNGQIHKTVTLTGMTEWINETYDFAITKLQYTNFKGSSNSQRMGVYNLTKP
jgi:hypothetical protein